MFLPLRVYAKDLHVKEKAFYTGLWVDAKEKIQAGTAKVSWERSHIQVFTDRGEYFSRLSV